MRQIGKTCSQECRQKRRVQTYIERYGTDKPQGLPQFLEKKVNTVRERYGVDYVSQKKEFSERAAITRSNTCQERNKNKIQKS